MLHTIKLSKIKRKAPFSVEIDGKTSRVELLNEPEFGKVFLVRTDGRKYKVLLEEFKDNAPFFVRVNNKLYKVEHQTAEMSPPPTLVAKPVSLPPRNQSFDGLVGRENAVTAPMPGILVSLKVKVGDTVDSGQLLCILESMKMENEIVSSKAGVVKEIHVSEGSSLRQGQIIVSIE
jgi:biotin carboxyl carrier protein